VQIIVLDSVMFQAHNQANIRSWMQCCNNHAKTTCSRHLT
jgi:hypothetical protein